MTQPITGTRARRAAIAARRAVVPVMGWVTVLAYLNGSVLHEAGFLPATDAMVPYGVPWPIALIQVAAVAVAAAGTAWRLLSPNVRDARSSTGPAS